MSHIDEYVSGWIPILEVNPFGAARAARAARELAPPPGPAALPAAPAGAAAPARADGGRPESLPEGTEWREDAGSSYAGPYCLLCRKWATAEHLATRGHMLRAAASRPGAEVVDLTT